MSAQVIYTGRIQGQNSAGTAVATVNPVEILANGDIRFTPAHSGQTMVIDAGQCEPAVMHLLRAIFVGTNGVVTSGRGPFFGAE